MSTLFKWANIKTFYISFYPRALRSSNILNNIKYPFLFSNSYPVVKTNICGGAFTDKIVGFGNRNFRGSTSKSKYLPLTLAFNLGFLFGRDEDDVVETDRSRIMTILHDGGLAFQQGKYQMAEQLFHIALKSAQELRDDQLITSIFAKLGVVSASEGKFEKAQSLFTETIKRYLHFGLKQDDNALIEVSLRLAEVHSSLGNLETAFEGYKFCIEAQEKKLKDEANNDQDTHALLGLSYDWFASFLLSIGEEDLASTYYKKALGVCELVMGESSLQSAVILSKLARICYGKKSFTEATEYLKIAVDIAETANDIDVINYYVSLGWVYKEQGLDDDAEFWFDRGLQAAKLTKDEDLIKNTILIIQGQEN